MHVALLEQRMRLLHLLMRDLPLRDSLGVFELRAQRLIAVIEAGEPLVKSESEVQLRRV